MKLKGTLNERQHPQFPKLNMLWEQFTLVSEDDRGELTIMQKAKVAEALLEIYEADRDAPLPQGESYLEVKKHLKSLAYPEGMHWKESPMFRQMFYPFSVEVGVYNGMTRKQHYKLLARYVDEGDIIGARQVYGLISRNGTHKLEFNQWGKHLSSGWTKENWNTVMDFIGEPRFQ